jgi:hypothetical protein
MTLADELPFEWRGGLLGAAFEDEHSFFDIGEASEVIRCKHLALDDREVDLHLVQPRGGDGTCAWQRFF